MPLQTVFEGSTRGDAAAAAADSREEDADSPRGDAESVRPLAPGLPHLMHVIPGPLVPP